MKQTPPYISIAEASARSGIEGSWLRRNAIRGTLKATKLGATWYIRPADLDRFAIDHPPRKGQPRPAQ